ncbi:Swi3-domain-containing protein [Leucogyrophana mollusca]|uniref:Swi3-domain-containing protein n=1 Tax=Leucogyrophana mollusca TaxID=85980 RepID=A0ACB8BLB2_9AGAM|nr:Swi3-domain-containing protein [Leucogyrophana mollusca]
MSLEDIWDAPISPPRSQEPADSNRSPKNTSSSPQKRSRPSLFLSDSDDELPVTKKPSSSAPVRPDIDAMFEDMEDDDDLAYKPLAPALDFEALRRQADAKHAKSAASRPALTPHQILPSSSPGPDNNAGDDGPDDSTKGKKKGKGEEDGKKERKKLPKLDEARLLGPNGFPQLIKDTKDFRIKGKGNEASDLNRILQVYQFWTHKMYPKTQFRDTVERVEKICHSKRMHVALSVWRDEAKGLVNGKKPDDDGEDVIDLTSDRDPSGGVGGSRSGTEEDDAPSHPPSLPPSSDGEDDDFDIDAVIREEEERLAAMRAANLTSTSPPRTAPKATYRSQPNTDADPPSLMDVDEDMMWDEIDAFQDPLLQPSPRSTTASSQVPDASTTSNTDHDQDEDMWDVVRELEGVENISSKTVKVPAALDGTDANTTRATNDDDWDDMYL